jgi:hypothetical protein
MKQRLRIAVSVFFALVAVAFAVLWVRSYFSSCVIAHFGSTAISFGTDPGCAFVTRLSAFDPYGPSPKSGWTYAIHKPPEAAATFRWIRTSGMIQVALPFWFLTTLAVALGAMPWIKSRFSLRTMLIVATLVIVVFGLLLVSIRQPQAPPIDHVDGPGLILER